MAMVKQSSSRHEQKLISNLESEIRAARQSGISSDQAKQIVRDVYGVKNHDTEEGDVSRLDVTKWNGENFDQEEEQVNIHKHVILPADTYKQYESKRSQRFSRPVAKIFLDHPERLEQYNVLRDHRFSRFMAIDIITKVYNNGGHEELPPKEKHTLDLTNPGWQKFMQEHKALFTKMYEMRIHEGLSHLQAINSIFKDMDHAYNAVNGKSALDHIDEIPEPVSVVSKDKHAPAFTTRDWPPKLKRRYFKNFRQNR